MEEEDEKYEFLHPKTVERLKELIHALTPLYYRKYR
jgi:hypothetical protein